MCYLLYFVSILETVKSNICFSFWLSQFDIFFELQMSCRWQCEKLWILHLMKKCQRILKFFWWAKRYWGKQSQTLYFSCGCRSDCLFSIFNLFDYLPHLYVFLFVLQIGEYQGAYKVRNAWCNEKNTIFHLERVLMFVYLFLVLKFTH